MSISTAYYRHKKEWRASLNDYFEEHGRTKTEAVSKLWTRIHAVVEAADKAPLMFRVPGEPGRAVVISPSNYGVQVRFFNLADQGIELMSAGTSHYASHYATWHEAVKSTRLHLAQLALGCDEDWLPYVDGYPELITEMYDYAAWQRRYADFKALGKTDAEAHELASRRA